MQLSDGTIASLCFKSIHHQDPWMYNEYTTLVQPLIVPFDLKHLQPGTYDVHLASELLFSHAKGGRIDLRVPREYEERRVTMNDGGYELAPNGLGRVKGATIERFCIPPWIQARFEGNTSLGRDFLVVHITANIVDAGFGWDPDPTRSAGATLTVEIVNLSPDIWVLYPGMRIGQISFNLLDKPAQRPYGHPDHGSHYQFQIAPTGNRVNIVDGPPATVTPIDGTPSLPVEDPRYGVTH